ncbi:MULTISPECIES: hypothetical protein [unclassified Bradyrhizobium]
MLEIERIHPESALQPSDGKPINFIVVFGRDASGRSGKAFFNNARAQKLHADILSHMDGSEDLKARRLTIDVNGEWKADREPRKRGGEVVKDPSGKPIYDRHFETNQPATFVEGPLLELFRIRREAKRRAYDADKLVQAGKTDEALALMRDFVDLLGRIQRAPKKGDEMTSVVAAATEGTTNEPIGSSEAASVVDEPTAAAGGESELEVVGDETSAAIQPADATLAASRPDGEADAVDQTSATLPTEEAPSIDPEAEAEARLAKAGRDFVDSAAGSSPAHVATTDAAAQPAATPAARRFARAAMRTVPDNKKHSVTEGGLATTADVYIASNPVLADAIEAKIPDVPAEKIASEPSPEATTKPAEQTPATTAARPAPRLPPRPIRPPMPIRRPGP